MIQNDSELHSEQAVSHALAHDTSTLILAVGREAAPSSKVFKSMDAKTARIDLTIKGSV